MGVYKNSNGSLERIAGGTFYADNPIGTILAFGGSNGQTSGPWYAVANEPYLVAAPTGAQYNDTETYVYGASQIKDHGDLSSQYLGLFSFPGERRLETLVLGNKTNG